MNINYKITTIILSVVLVIVLVYCWQCMSRYNNIADENNNLTPSNTANMHMMPDGTMMMNSGSNMNMMDMTMNDMVADLEGKTGKDLEKAFLMGMIPHHQGAVDMAKLLLQDKNIGSKFINFADDIITAQEAEITMMKEWLKNY